ncbi:MAG: CHAT domain-containing protein [Vicinamibacterales bacterium]
MRRPDLRAPSHGHGRGRRVAAAGTSIVAAVAMFQALASARGPAADPEAELARIEALYARAQFAGAAEALARLRQAPDLSTLQRARLLMRLAAAQVELGRYEEALRTADEADLPARDARADELLIRTQIVRGSAWRFLSFSFRGVQHYEEAVALAERARRDDLRAEAFGLLGNAYALLGDWSRTLDYAARAFDANPNPSDDTRFWYHTNRGIAYYEFHDRDRAEESFRRGLEIAQQTGRRRSESVALGELGLVAWELDGNRERALELYDRAISIARDIGVPLLEATWLNNAGNVFRDTGEYAPALDRYRQALALNPARGDRRDPVPVKNIGQVLAAMGRTQEAERFLLEAVAAADRRDNGKIRWQARMELGDLYRASDAARADRYYRESLETLEAGQNTVLLEGFRAGMLGRALNQYDPYDRYIGFLLGRGDEAGAFAVAERARARVFLESLTAARTELAATIPGEYLQAETELLRRISAHQRELRAPTLEGDRRRDLLAQITLAEDELTSLRLRLAADRPAVVEARFPRLQSLEDVRTDVLGDDEALVMFFLGRDASTAWILDRSGTSVVSLPARDAIERAVRRLLPTLQSPDATIDEDARAWLSETLVAPVVARAPEGAHLVIVPHAILNYLPFELLRDDGGRHLIERHTVSYAPSVSSLAYLRRRATSPASDTRTVLAVGSPATQATTPAAERDALASIGLLKPLPHSRAEIRRVASMFRPHSRLLEGEAATEEALHAGVDRAGILHIATHALVDEERPERSGLALSPGGQGSDGILQMREVYSLDLDAALVTLSACQTALGREVTGEGLVGLSRAFFYAGANAVMASLWSVNDASTSALMEHVYTRIREGASIDRALADAKRAFLRGPAARRHPYYWAPFILTGHARVAMDFPPSPWITTAALALGAAGATLAGAVALVVLKRRRHATGR